MILSDQIKLIKQQIGASVLLIAVSKNHSYDAIKDVYAQGIHDFAESYLQEAQTKIAQLSNLPITWHFIGPIQSNKTRSIAESFSWVHSVSRLKIAQLLNDARPESLPPLNVCLQINLDDEETKSGLPATDAAELANKIQTLPRLALRGLMAIPKPLSNEDEQYHSFLRLTTLRDELNQALSLTMDTLSMGMSDDFLAAVRAGSTMVRIGTGIFGKRLASADPRRVL
jgi:pyridoxal phosphate enzyme (YggS family)